MSYQLVQMYKNEKAAFFNVAGPYSSDLSFPEQGTGKMQEKSVPWMLNRVAEINYEKLILEKWDIKLI